MTCMLMSGRHVLYTYALDTYVLNTYVLNMYVLYTYVLYTYALGTYATVPLVLVLVRSDPLISCVPFSTVTLMPHELRQLSCLICPALLQPRERVCV